MPYSTCQFPFIMQNRPKNKCDLPIYDGHFCKLHSPSASNEDRLILLYEEKQKYGHWLEGIFLQCDLKKVNLSGVRMPRANFEGANIESSRMDRANLEGAIFRSAVLSNVSFCHSNLQDAIFDRAVFKPINEYSVDLRDAEIGGATFLGAKIDAIKFQGISLSKPTNVYFLLNSLNFEKKTGNWEAASTIYTAFGKRAREDWDILSEDLANFEAMTCKHRRIIHAGPILRKSYFRNWIVPTVKKGPKGILWFLQRIVWGYGYRPLNIAFVILTTIVLFSVMLFLAGGTSIIDSILLSTQSFFTVTYGKILPPNKLCEAIGTFEAFLGAILVSLFVVSLATRFMRRI